MPEQLIQLDQLSEDIRTFWEQKQQELGEGLVTFSYGILITPKASSIAEKCGVIFLTERHLCFEDFYKPPLFFQSANPAQFKKTQLKIPRASITQKEILQQEEFEKRFFGQEPSSGLLQNLLGIFRQKPRYLVLSGMSESREPQTYIFKELDDPERWLEALQHSEGS